MAKLKKPFFILILSIVVLGLCLTPLVNADATNLAPMFQGGTCEWGNYNLFGVVCYGPRALPQICFKDDTILHNGSSSIRLEHHTSADINTAREVNSAVFNIAPGDTVVYSCWIKTDNGTSGRGGRIGLDFYDNYKRIAAMQSDGQHGIYPNENDQAIIDHFVSWDSGDWVQRTIEFTVPLLIQADGWGGYPQGGSYEPTSIILWIQAESATETEYAYFADASLTINAEGAAYPTNNPNYSGGGAAVSPLMIGYLVPFIVIGCIFLGVYSAMKEFKGRK